MKQYTAKIIVAAHKPYTMPDDEMYLPVHVGAAGKESIGYQRDDEGENISSLNPYFCELTGLYWAWKNLNEDYIGLVHYRRHFAMNGKTMEYEQLKPYLGKIKIFIPKKRWYVIETLQSHYEHTHYSEHIEKTREWKYMKKKSLKLNFIMNIILTMSSFIFPLITFPCKQHYLSWPPVSDLDSVVELNS